MGSSFSLIHTDVEIDVARLADRLISDPRVQTLLAEHADLARSLTKTHEDLAKSLSQDSHRLVEVLEKLSIALERDSRTLTNELTALSRVLAAESGALGRSYSDLGVALTCATYAVSGVLVLCGLVYSHKLWQEASRVQTKTIRDTTPVLENTTKAEKEPSNSTGSEKEEMMELKITANGGTEYVITVPLKAINMFSTGNSKTEC